MLKGHLHNTDAPTLSHKPKKNLSDVSVILLPMFPSPF